MPILSAVPKKWTVRERRKRLGLSQEALAERAGLDQQDISRIELGKVSEPGFTKGLRLADALQLDPHDLQFGAGAAA